MTTNSYRKILSFIFLIVCGNIFASENPELKLWYDQPAKNWNEALPIGNGRLGGMVFSEPGKEVIQLNESSIWSGAPSQNDNPKALGVLSTVREYLFAGRFAEAQDLCWNNMIASDNMYCAKYQTLGNVLLTFAGHANYSDFYRELDLERAVVTSTYQYNGVKYKREVFATKPDDAIVMRITAEQPGSISFQAAVNSPLLESTSTEGNRIILNGRSGDYAQIKGSVLFTGIVSIDKQGGTSTSTKNTIRVTGADEVVIRITAATNFVNYKTLEGESTEKAKQLIEKVEKSSFDDLYSAHVKAYQHYFKRVDLNLGVTPAQNNTTKERVKYFNRANDPALVALYYQFGRYLLISCSQPGGQPANLQGIWNDQTNPAWGSKYTININTEMNYWPAETANLSEMHEPLIEMVKELSDAGKKSATSMYGCRGWVTHHNTDIWRSTGAVDGAFWGMWPMGGAWLSQHLWEKYLYNGDKEYLRSIYPALKGASEFFLDFMVPEPKGGKLVVSPSISPENAPSIRPDHSVSYGNTMDNQIVDDLFSKTIMAAELLQEDVTLINQLKTARGKLLPMQIGKYTQLQEWVEDLDSPTDNHRHVSHLYGVFPSGQISPYRTPELLEAARNSLKYRGDISTGWSMGWKVNLWARFLDGNRALKLIQDQLTLVDENSSSGGTYPNLFDAHPPFQIDGNFGCVSGINEMLLQSYDGAIHLLPALPDNWQSGSFAGFRVRGGFEVDAKWENGVVSHLVIKSTLGGNCRLRVPNQVALEQGGSLQPAQGENSNAFYYVPELKKPLVSGAANFEGLTLKETFLFDLDTKPGETYVLVAASAPKLISAAMSMPTKVDLTFDQPILAQETYTGFNIRTDKEGASAPLLIQGNKENSSLLCGIMNIAQQANSELWLTYANGNVTSVYHQPLLLDGPMRIENLLPGSAPLLKNASTNVTGDSITLTFNQPLISTDALSSGFRLESKTNNANQTEIEIAKAVISDNNPQLIYLLPARTVFAEDTLTLGYQATHITTANGGLLQPFLNFPIQNNAYGMAPEIIGSGIDAANYRVVLVFSKPMAEAYPYKELFSLEVNGKNESVKDIWKQGDSLLFETERTFHDIDQVQISYQGTGVKATDGGSLSPFSNYRINNNLPSVDYQPVPGRIQAENYYAQQGVQAEPSQDEDGTDNLGWISDGDWMEYAVEVEKAGTYSVTFRIASPDGESIIDLIREDQLLLSATLGKTNSWQYYQSFSFNVDLEKGKQYLKLFVKKSGFNFNWFEFALTSANKRPVAEKQCRITPNPNNGSFEVNSDRPFKEVLISDMNGMNLFESAYDQAITQTSLTTELQSGVYLLQLLYKESRQTQRLVVVR